MAGLDLWLLSMGLGGNIVAGGAGTTSSQSSVVSNVVYIESGAGEREDHFTHSLVLRIGGRAKVTFTEGMSQEESLIMMGVL